MTELRTMEPTALLSGQVTRQWAIQKKQAPS
ncbi:hypothetical protein CLV76_1068 [Marivita geojedonensis]|nr:hypothetical protein CLV76_1068 [Marivita geojedonensis]